jgi:hypothetical protein
MTITGGCQCGAVRFAISGDLGRASICHCRMCQKAFGAFYGPLVGVRDLTWTRGEPRHFRSSNLVRRGFCADCGTPLTFEPDGGVIDVAIGALDDPSAARPVIQLAVEDAIPWVGELAGLPVPQGDAAQRMAARYARIISFQHPDHETQTWPPPD